MGRKKIEIKFITNKRERTVRTFQSDLYKDLFPVKTYRIAQKVFRASYSLWNKLNFNIYRSETQLPLFQ